MSMNVGSSSEDDMIVDINTTPLIDVMLVLLIMLIVTIPVQLHAVKIDLPSGTPPPPPKPPIVQTVDIDFDGTISWNGTVLSTEAALESKLREVAAEPDQDEVHVAPNRLVAYKSVAMVMGDAQRLGVTKIGVVGNEQFAQ